MMEEKVTVQAEIDGRTFSEYALFDVMRRQKRWLRPVLFAAFFVLMSVLAFSRRRKAEQAALLGWALLAVGLVLPLVYLINFFLSVRR